MKLTLQIRFLTIASALFFLSCNKSEDKLPSYVLGKDKMAAVLIDIHLAEAASDNRSLNLRQINLAMAAKYQALFKKHGVSFEEFRTSYTYYLENAHLLAEIYTEVVNELTTLDSKVKSRHPIKPAPVERKDSSLKSAR